ncbi:MAG: hypothetical protein IT501_07310 [Rubrivivax sp.]|jgi:hypothetical protein|nr:hypothetical protein [Rubrivivax sp.]
MDARDWTVGSRIEHPVHGPGTVTSVGTDYLGIAFDDSGEVLIRREAFAQQARLPQATEPIQAPRKTLPWPASTFVAEPADTPHYMGSHWDPFVEDSAQIIDRLPEIVPGAMVQTGYGEARKPDWDAPPDWPLGFQLVWPLREQGLALILKPEEQATVMASLFPFFARGSQQTLTLHAVSVWEGGLQAQIEASWGDAEVTFFDTQYLINRVWYQTGKSYDFILTGIAYSANVAERHEWTIDQHPDVVAWLEQNLQEGEQPHAGPTTVSLDGASVFLPVEGWDVDDYSFHAPVKSVTEFQDWLGQDGWRVRATVMRVGEGEGQTDADLDIVITRRAWAGAAPPQVGQDIEGRLWLQGYLWMPEFPKSPRKTRKPR